MTGYRLSANLRVVLGPTNTGKTHLAMERLLAHQSGMIGLPLRLLAREVYDRTLAGHFGRVHRADVALITGEEKILPANARYFICTTEAMPISREVEFVAVDECQLAADPERGHVFTDRVLHARGTSETMLLGAPTMGAILSQLLDVKNIESRARFSGLSWAGGQKLSRLPRRTAITAFSAENVYAIAEIVRQQRGGAAVVMGGLSPRTRNAQVAMYQSGEVDFLIATDAIGMGLNMDVDHVAFAQRRKFDGRRHRDLSAAELAQIAGRAGRHTNDGTFGVTGELDLFDEELIEQIETHQFEPVRSLMWRNPNLDFSSLDALLLSLERPAPRRGLQRAPESEDVQALKFLSRDPQTLDLLGDEPRVRRLWEVAQIPDFRQTTIGEHGALVGEIFAFLCRREDGIPHDWLAERVERCDQTHGDLDTLAMRLAHIRSWTYVAQRSDWLGDPLHWQQVTREVEDRLSDALHAKLMGQFVDRQSSALLKRLRGNEEITAEIEASGDILVAGEYMGRLVGLHMERDPSLKSAPAGTARAAVEKTASAELRMRAQTIASAPDSDFSLDERGQILWSGAVLGELKIGEEGGDNAALAYLTPTVTLKADETLTGDIRQRAQARLTDFVRAHIGQALAPLVALSKADDLTGLARGLAFQLLENKGNLARRDIADMLGQLDQTLRGTLRKYGVRFGFYNVYLPLLLKPQAARLLGLLTSLEAGRDAPRDMADLPGPGLTSVPRAKLPARLYRAAGFYPTKARAIRLDMLERLADIIRPLLQADTQKQGFLANEAMMSIMGCGADELTEILEALGYQPHHQPANAPDPSNNSKQASADAAPDTAATQTSRAETSADTISADAAAEETTAETSPDPAMLTYWRLASRRPKASKKPKGKAKARPHTSAKPKPQAKLDPNSPFAVLRQLTDNGNAETASE